MKNISFMAIVCLLFTATMAIATETPVPADQQYTQGQAQAQDSQTHGSTMGASDQFQVGGFETGFADVGYGASDPVETSGWGTAEVVMNGFSFFYDPSVDGKTGGEAHSSTTSSSLGQTFGSQGQITFNQGAEQGSWVTMPGELEFGYSHNQTGIQNSGSVESEGNLSAENQAIASGNSVVSMGSGDGTRFTKVSTYGDAHNTNPDLQSGFYGEGGYGGGNTLINGNAAVQGQFSGTMNTVDPCQSFVSGSGQVNLTNRYESGVGNVVRAEVSSTSSVGGGQ